MVLIDSDLAPWLVLSIGVSGPFLPRGSLPKLIVMYYFRPKIPFPPACDSWPLPLICAPNVSVTTNHGSDRPGTGEERFSSCRIPSDYARLRILVKADLASLL